MNAAFVLLLALCVAVLVLSSSSSLSVAGSCPFVGRQQPSSAAAAPATAADPLETVNNYFLAQYDATKQQLVTDLQNRSIVMVVDGNATLITYYGGGRTAEPLTPPLYTALKMVAHVALGAFTLLQPTVARCATAGSEPQRRCGIAPEQQAVIGEFVQLVAAAEASLDGRFPNATVTARQQQIVALSRGFLQAALGAGGVSPAQLLAFTGGIAPLLQQNVWDATVASLDELHAAVMRWQSIVPLAAWQNLTVIMSGSHMARRQASYLQYFARMMDTPQTLETRLMFGEGLDAEDDLLALLGTHLNDQGQAGLVAGSGLAFFHNATRMHTDLLATSTEIYLPSLLPRSPCCY